ncbi:hypothetical protein [Streptomyces mirabilis]
MTGWLTRHPATLTEEEKLHRKDVLDRCPELASAAELTSSFAEMLTTLSGDRLPEWITEATKANLPGISSFATGLNSDFDAVTAGLTTDWNSEPRRRNSQPDQDAQTADVRPRRLRSAAQAGPAVLRLRSVRAFHQSEAVLELFQKHPPRRIRLLAGHGGEQAEELVLLLTCQPAHDVGDALQNFDGIVLIRLLVFTVFDEPENIDQCLGQSSRQGGVRSRHPDELPAGRRTESRHLNTCH